MGEGEGEREGGVIAIKGKRGQPAALRNSRKSAANGLRLTLRVRANCAESFNFLCKWRTRGTETILFSGGPCVCTKFQRSRPADIRRLFHPEPGGASEQARAG